MAHPLTPVQRTTIVEMRRSGATYVEIQRTLGVGEKVVWRYCRDAGLVRRPDEVKIARMIEMRETRHCEVSCWLAGNGQALHVVYSNGMHQPDPEFVARYVEARDRLDALEAQGSV